MRTDEPSPLHERRLDVPLVLLLVGASAFVALAVAVAVHPGPFPLDRAAHGVHPRGGLLSTLRALTHLGTLPWLLVPLALLLPVGARPPRKATALLVVAALVAIEARTGIAAAVGRPRPPIADWLAPAGGGSFPSGHTATAAVAASVSLLLAWRRVSPAAWLARCAGWTALVLLVATTRVALGVHWVSDVAGGAAYGLVFAGAAALVWWRSSLLRGQGS